MDYLSENTMIRYLKSYEWSVDEAFARLQWSEQWRKDHNCMKISFEEIKQVYDQKMLTVYGHDKVGRSVIYIRMNKFIPANLNFEQFIRFSTYSFDKACMKMKKNVD